MKTITRSFYAKVAFALALSCLTAFVLATRVSSEAARNASPGKAKAAIRSFDIGQGPKTYSFQLGRETATQYNGSSSLQQAFEAGQVQPRTMISDDFNGDGMGDLVIGYQKGGAGVLGMRQGNLQAISPTDPNVFQGITEGRYPSPFLPEVTLYSLPEAPDFLQFGDFNSDGYPDVMTAARGAQKLYLLAGDGRGNLGEPQTIEIQGLVTEMRAGTEQVGTFTQLALGLSVPGGAQLAVYNNKEDLAGEPESFPMAGEVNGLAFDQLDGDGIADLAATTSNEVVVVHGRSLEPTPTSDVESLGARDTKPAFVERQNVSFAIRGLATGDFSFDRNHQREIALLAEDGTVHLLARGTPDTRPFSRAEKKAIGDLRRSLAREKINEETLMAEINKMIRPNGAAGWKVAQTMKGSSAYTGTGKTVFQRLNASNGLDELIVGDGINNSIKTLRNELDEAKLQIQTQQSSDLKETSVEGSPIAAVSMRLSIGAKPGTVLLGAKEIEPTIVIFVAHNFTVNSTADLPDSVPTAANGVCQASNGLCTLRAAIMQSNHSGGENTITVPDGTYTLTLGPPDDEANTGGALEQSGDLDIFSWNLFDGSPVLNSVSIVGGTRDGCIIQMGTLSPTLGTNVPNNKERILEVNDVAVIGFNSRVNVTLTNMTMQNGFSPTSSGTFLEGGAIYFDGSRPDNTNIGLLTLTNVKLSANTSAGQGGGVWAGFGSLTVQTTSIVRANTATNQSGGGVAWTGGNTVETQGFTMANSTIGGALVADGNQATDPTFGAPGGLDARGGLFVTISGSTVQNNVANVTAGQIGGGGIQINSPTVAISTTTISNNKNKGNGGGLWSSARNAVTNASSTITLTTVNVTGNQADSDTTGSGDGGGIFNFFGAMTIQTNSHVDGNSAVNGGGIFAGWTGIAADPTAGLTVSNSTIGQAGAGNGNSATNNGGSIAINPVGAVAFNPINLNTLTFTNNTANSDSVGGGDGGAIFVGAGQLTSLNGCTIDGNVANGGLGDGIRQTGGTITGAGTVSINGGDSLHLSGGTFTSTPGTLNLTGNLTRDTGHTFTHNSGTVTFNGSGAQTMNGTATSITFFNLIVNKSGGSLLNTGGSLATITTSTYTNTLGDFTAPATMDINGLVTLTAGTFTSGTNITAAANWTNNGGTFAGGTGTVTFDGAVAQQINGTAAAQTFNNVNVNKGGGSILSTGGSTTSVTVNNLTMTAGTFTAPATLDINGNTTLLTGSTLTAGANITAGGSWTHNVGATFTPGTGTVTFDGATAANLNGTQTPQTFNNFTVNKPGGTLTGAASLTTLTLLGSMTITAGTFSAGTITTINVPGNWSNTGTFTAGTSTVILNGVGNVQTLSGTTTFNNLTSNHTGAGNVTSVGSTLNATGLFRVQAGTFNIGNATLAGVQIDSTTTLAGTNATTINVAGNWSNSGTFTPNTNTVNFNGGGAQTLGGTNTTQTFHHFTVNKGGGSTLSVIASTNTLDINGDVTLTAGTFAAGTALAITVAGNWTNNGGTFTPGTGTVTFDGGAGQTIGGTNATTFNNLTNGNASGLAMSNNNNVNAILALTSSDITVAAGMTLTQASTVASTGTFDVVGNVKRTNTPNPLSSGVALTFGNPNNQINFAAVGTRPTDVTVNLVKTAPADFLTAVQRTYTITPTGGSGFSATLRLRYLDAELNGNVEAELGLWRFGAAWARQGKTAADAANNWVELSGVTQFSPWTLSSAKNNSTIQITADTPDPSGINQAVPINWTAASSVTGAPALTGNVTITVDDASGNTCTAAVGAGTCNLTFTTVGSKTLTATYTGDTNFNGTTDTEPHGVVQANVFVRDARAAEPAAGSTNMLFTVTLSTPSSGAASVNFTTNTGGATPATPGTCGAGGDYVTTSGTVNFAAGQQVQTIAVPICADATVEPDETFLVDLSVPVNLTISDGQATGTITANTPGAVLISELRTSGPAGSTDEFVEVYNNSDSQLTVAAVDASAGYGLFKSGAAAGDTPVLIGTIPNGTVIPARGHYLMVGSAYSLANYGGTGAAAGNLTMSADIENDRNVGLFATADIANISSTTSRDAVGFGTNTGGNFDLLREGSNLPPVFGSTTEHSFFRKLLTGTPQDTNDNVSDFQFADTLATLIAGVTRQLGAPGPENLLSPIQRNATIKATFIDPGCTGTTTVATQPCPRFRDLTSDPANNSTLGTLSIRRRFVNNTGAAVTRLRFRIVDITTFPPGAGAADMRARTSGNQSATCIGTGLGCSAPGAVITINGTTLETPPAQSLGGGQNSSMSAGTITLATPLTNGASINLQFLLGVQASGAYRFFVNVEALP
jgi:CSLREA domain-containing protein